MSPRSLFRLILKLIGIFLLKDILVSIPNLFIQVQIMFTGGVGIDLITVISLLSFTLIYCTLIYSLLFRTENIIDLLRLDKGFSEETFNLNIHRSSLLKIILILFGGSIIIDTVPSLISQFTLYLQAKRFDFLRNSENSRMLVISITKFVLGIVLIIYAQSLVNFIELRRKKSL